MMMAKMLMMMMTMTVAEPSLSGSLVQIVWKNEEGGSALVGGQICTQRIPRVHTFNILARGEGHGGSTETEHPLFFCTASLSPSSLSCFFSSVKIDLVAAEELGPN